MKRLFAIILGMLCALLFSAAHVFAFQEQDVPVTAPEKGGVGKSVDQDHTAALSGSGGVEKSAKKSGTSVYIPGIGAVGSWPDLDFGLELLYKDDKDSSAETLDDDGVAIKGRIKHKF